MSLQKELCLICERPTADGAVSAVHVDKEKLQTWFLNVCEYEMAEEIEDEDKICYFCAWHAEFQWKFNGMSDETFVWWNSDLDDAVKELRKHYFEGNVEQCWVQLEVIQIPDHEKDQVKEDEKNGKKCFYCMKVFSFSTTLNIHLKKTHKDVIRSAVDGVGDGMEQIGLAVAD
ncbi:Hypothetical predicted protein [Cloeon dipterum]|uniref:C2H2-type domain-containing protein n=1 Tax=Cloeon dipterum TaxID=197152 RepID=A0A8S1E3Y4_9INSE|nr:Hypothetical predicted protein [Cloeon dipterum]